MLATCRDPQNSEAQKLSKIPNIDVIEMDSTNEDSCVKARETIEQKVEESGNCEQRVRFRSCRNQAASLNDFSRLYLELSHITDLWAVVCSENFCEAAEIDWQDSASIQRIVDVNVLGTIRTVKTFIPNLRKTKGRIVIASSVMGMLIPNVSTFN